MDFTDVKRGAAIGVDALLAGMAGHSTVIIAYRRVREQSACRAATRDGYNAAMPRPMIGITVDNKDNTAESGQYESAIAYSRAVVGTGGAAVLLPHEADAVEHYVARLDGFVLTGGTDPRTEPFGEPTHVNARPMDARRQAFELTLLQHLASTRPDTPVLGVCLGMQLMALHAGGRLHQYLPDVLQDAAVHQDNRLHAIECVADDSLVWDPVASGNVRPPLTHQVVSSHQQAVSDPATMRTVAMAPDGVIEAIDLPPSQRRFYVGVQWHPERMANGDDTSAQVNRALFDRFVGACRPST